MGGLVPVVPEWVAQVALRYKGRYWVPFPFAMSSFPVPAGPKMKARLLKDHSCVVVHPAMPDVGVLAVVREEKTSNSQMPRYSFQFLWRVRIVESMSVAGETPDDTLWLAKYENLSQCTLSKEEFYDGENEIEKMKLVSLYLAVQQGLGREVDPDNAVRWVNSPLRLSQFSYSVANSVNSFPLWHPLIEENLLCLLREDDAVMFLERMVNLLGYLQHKVNFGDEPDSPGSPESADKALMGSRSRRRQKPASGQPKEDPDKDLPPEVLEVVKRELSRIAEHPSTENQVIQTYVDTLRRFPWTKLTTDQPDFNTVHGVLDEDHFGLDRVKNVILEYLAEQKLNAKSRGTILCLVGPPGVGKTSLGKSIARSLGRAFIRQSLGGMRDEAEIRGHRRTYIGALPGRIIKGLTTSGTLNPVFMLDEIDKLGNDSFRGSPEDALLEVLDPEQNHAFTDHYMEIPVDLSHVLFIATANTSTTIHRALLDRMEMVHLPGYSEEEKLIIARKYLIPKQLAACGLVSGEGDTKVRVNIPDETISSAIRGWTREAGVRDLERKLRTIFRKVGLQYLKKEPSVASGVIDITPEILPKYLGDPHGAEETRDIANLPAGVAPFLAVDGNGEGSIGFIEVSTRSNDHFKMKITGNLAKVMEESVEVAMSRVMHSNILTDDERKGMEKKFFHIHFDSGAIPKDGPSAGVMIATAITSAVKKKSVKTHFGGTGEISLCRKAILPIGGAREKILAAEREGLREVFIPKANERAIDDLPPEFRKRVHLVTFKSDEHATSKLAEFPEGIVVYSLETPEQAFELAFEIGPSSELVFAE